MPSEKQGCFRGNPVPVEGDSPGQSWAASKQGSSTTANISRPKCLGLASLNEKLKSSAESRCFLTLSPTPQIAWPQSSSGGDAWSGAISASSVHLSGETELRHHGPCVTASLRAHCRGRQSGGHWEGEGMKKRKKKNHSSVLVQTLMCDLRVVPPRHDFVPSS